MAETKTLDYSDISEASNTLEAVLVKVSGSRRCLKYMVTYENGGGADPVLPFAVLFLRFKFEEDPEGLEALVVKRNQRTLYKEKMDTSTESIVPEARAIVGKTYRIEDGAECQIIKNARGRLDLRNQQINAIFKDGSVDNITFDHLQKLIENRQELIDREFDEEMNRQSVEMLAEFDF